MFQTVPFNCRLRETLFLNRNIAIFDDYDDYAVSRLKCMIDRWQHIHCGLLCAMRHDVVVLGAILMRSILYVEYLDNKMADIDVFPGS